MRKFIVSYSLLFVIGTVHAQQYGWVRVAQLGNQFTSLSAVEFVDSMHGWTAYGSDNIYRTTDGGFVWQGYGGPPMGVYSISMIDTARGWCAGDNGSTGRILHTTNGGLNWSLQWDVSSRNIRGTFGQSGNRNSTSGYARNSPDTGKVVQTNNGGATWSELTIPDAIQLTKVQFVDSLHGWIIYNAGVLRTTDGGITWTANPFPRFFEAISFLDTLIGWAVSANAPTYSYRTTDGGITWVQRGRIFDPMWDDLNPSALSFVDSLNGWAFGLMFYQGDLAAVIFRTSDGGLSWYREFVGGGARAILDGMMLDRYHGWAVGDFGSVFAFGVVSSVPERLESEPKSFALRQNYPNPFNPNTTVEYEIVQREWVTIRVYDTKGKQVNTIVNGEHEPGVYRIHFDASGLASGVYYCTMKTDSFTETKQMVLIK